MDGEHRLKSFAADGHMDAMLMVQMDTIPTDDFAAHYDYHADHDSGFSSSMKLLSTNSFANRHCYQENNEAKMVSQFYDHRQRSSSNLNGHPVAPYYIANSGYGKRQASSVSGNENNSIASMREVIFRIAAMQPIRIDPESVKPAKRRNVKISKDPQSVAARHRRERISERIRILQRLVPGGIKMYTASMLDEAVHSMNFLKTQVQSLEKGSRH